MLPLLLVLVAVSCQRAEGSPKGVTAVVGVALVGGAAAIKCNIDTQGIPVEDEHKVLAEYRKFDCSLGGGDQVTCVKEIKMVDGKKVVLRNCGTAEVKNNCTTVHDVTRCYCMEDYCNHSETLTGTLSGLAVVLAAILATFVLL